MSRTRSDPASQWVGVVWLDRDGTLVDDPGYLADPAQLILLPGAAGAVASLNAAGFCVVLVTNQSGIARGLMSRETVDRIHAALRSQLEQAGAHLDGIYLCPHLPASEMKEGQQACDCRKPEPGLILRARKELQLAGLPSVVVGDKVSDLELAGRTQSASVLVLTGDGRASQNRIASGEVTADQVCEDLAAAARWIRETLGPGR